MRQIDARLVEQHVAQPPAEHDAERGPGEEVIGLHRRRHRRRLPHQPPQQPPAEHQPGDVGQRVPADAERPDLHDDRVELREQQDRDHA